MRLALIGAGGHSKAVVETLHAAGHELVAYVDPRPAPWLDAPRLAGNGELSGEAEGIVMGLGGVAPEALRRRLELFRDYRGRGFAAPPLTHPAAQLSSSAVLSAGAMVLAGAMVQPGAWIGEAAIVNTGAIIEHDSTIGAGSHISPGAIVLGAARIGTAAMIGAGATVLPGTMLPEAGFVKAASLTSADGAED